jgi:adenylate cyclase
MGAAHEKNSYSPICRSKLAKFLPAQLYNSIFTGSHSARVAAKRKKLTIFFSDIANFTEPPTVSNPRN